MQHSPARRFAHIQMRSFKIVIDLEDPFAPELTIENFVRRYGREPETPRYRVVAVELVTCPEDSHPVLVTECGQCPRFVRRFKDHIECSKALDT
ncbi:MAG: hypothetical protein V1857_01285 [archaeon]